MRCPACTKQQNYVIETKTTPQNNHRAIRRRRSCVCGFRWTTYEVYRMQDLLGTKVALGTTLGRGLGNPALKTREGQMKMKLAKLAKQGRL